MYEELYAPLPDAAAYLNRIGLAKETPEPTAQWLDRLVHAQLTHIPFDAMDVWGRGDTPSLAIDDLFDKIILRRRGGYCFEMNGFFCAILQEMGFPAYGVLTRLSRDGKTFGGYLHRMNLTEADGVRYICDVGYGGDCFCRPLRLEYDVPQTVHGMVYRVVPGTVPEVEYTVQIQRGEEFQDLMGFIDRPAQDEDFQVSNYYVNH